MPGNVPKPMPRDKITAHCLRTYSRPKTNWQYRKRVTTRGSERMIGKRTICKHTQVASVSVSTAWIACFLLLFSLVLNKYIEVMKPYSHTHTLIPRIKCDNKLLWIKLWAFRVCEMRMKYWINYWFTFYNILWDERSTLNALIRELMKQFVCLSAISLSILIWFNFLLCQSFSFRSLRRLAFLQASKCVQVD